MVFRQVLTFRLERFNPVIRTRMFKLFCTEQQAHRKFIVGVSKSFYEQVHPLEEPEDERPVPQSEKNREKLFEIFKEIDEDENYQSYFKNGDLLVIFDALSLEEAQ